MKKMEKKLRMAFFHPRTHNNIVALLAQVVKKYEVHVYSYDNNKPLQHPDIHYHRVPLVCLNEAIEPTYFPWFGTIFSAVKSNDILVFKGLGTQMSMYGLFFARILNKRAVVFVQGISTFSFFGGSLFAVLFKFLLNNKTVPILSQTTRAHKRASAWSNCAHFLPFAVDVSPLSRHQNSKMASHESDVNKKALTLLVVSKIQRRKNIIPILELYMKLRAQSRSTLKLVIASKLVRDLKYLDEVKRFISDHDLSDSVHINIGLTGKEMEKLYLSSDVYLLLSYDEPAAYSHLEAMNYGVAVVINSHNGTSDYIVDGKDGIILKTDDADKIYKQILDFLNSDLRRAGIHAKQTICKKYASEIVAAQFEKIISKR